MNHCRWQYSSAAPVQSALSPCEMSALWVILNARERENIGAESLGLEPDALENFVTLKTAEVRDSANLIARNVAFRQESILREASVLWVVCI